jgi:hypothetical protein
MTRKILIATVSAFALSSGAAFAEGDCGKMDHMQNAAMSVQTGDNIQLAQNDAATKKDGAVEVTPGEDGNPTEAMGDQVEGGGMDDEAAAASEKAGHAMPTDKVGQAKPQMQSDENQAGSDAADKTAQSGGDDMKSEGGEMKADGEKMKVTPGEEGPTEAMGDEVENIDKEASGQDKPEEKMGDDKKAQ